MENVFEEKPREQFEVPHTIGMYSIKDKTAGEFFAPFLAVNDMIAERMLEMTMIENKIPTLTHYAEQHALYKIGVFNSKTGEINQDIKIVCEAEKYKQEK